MRRNDAAIVAICALAIGAMLCAWAWAMSASEYDPPQLWKNGYWPFTVEISIRDR